MKVVTLLLPDDTVSVIAAYLVVNQQSQEIKQGQVTVSTEAINAGIPIDATTEHHEQ